MLPLLRKIQQDTLGFLMEAVHQNGDLVSFAIPGQSVVLVNNPEWIKHILLDNHHNYTKDTIQYNSLSKITGRGLLTSDGDAWFRNRRLEQPAFARPRLLALDQIVVPAAQKMLAEWATAFQQAESLDIDRQMMRLALEIVGKALFSIDLSQKAHALTGAVMTALDYIMYQARSLIVPPLFLPTPRNLHFRQAIQTLDQAVDEIISSRRRLADPGDDLLGMLLKGRDLQTRLPLSSQQLRNEVITLLIAGHETVASALTWSWYLLANNPDARRRLQAEVEEVLENRLPASTDLPRLKYTYQVFAEALRLYPPAWLITRRAVQADQLGPFTLPAGSLVIISPYTIHRHPAFWENPELFNPDRFVEDNESKRQRFAYIPFGGGPRLCIGSNFALIEAQLILAVVIQRYQLDLLPGSIVQPDALVTIRPRGGLPMRIYQGK
jgi:cytochrome P450